MTNLLGAKTDELNSACMNDKILCILLLTSPLLGAPAREGVPIQELRLQCQEFNHTLHAQKMEMEILQEKLQTLESAVSSLNKDMGSSPELAKDRLGIFEKRVATLEKTQETLISDLKILKNHLNDSSSSLSACQKQLTALEKQLSQDVLSLKNSLQSMIALLQKGDLPTEKTYTVKPGDSLGKIALDCKVDIKTLKELNHLSNDRIYIGQKLQLP